MSENKKLNRHSSLNPLKAVCIQSIVISDHVVRELWP
jgi:hypothetical protein